MKANPWIFLWLGE